MFGLSLASTVNSLQAVVAAKDVALRSQTQQCDLLRADNEKLNVALKDRDDDIASLRDELDGLLGDYAILERQLSDVKSERDELSGRCATLDNEASLLRSHSFITNEYLECLAAIFSDDKSPIFISGPAGTGKSTLIRAARGIFSRAHPARALQVVAPTGIAAENIGGRTIHSFFGFPPVKNPVTRYLADSPQGEVFRKTDILIVDEASMVSASLVDAMDKALRYLTRKDDIPFGGAKVVFVGDMGQLPPVKAKYFFEACAIDANRLRRRMLRLATIFRQSETAFIEALLQVRRGPNSVSKQSALLLAGQYDPNPPPPSERTTLCPTNAEADQLNRQGLSDLPGCQKDYDMRVSGNVTPSQMDDSKLPRILSLKIGARVIFLENKLLAYCNGTIGIVVGLGEDVVNVRLPSGDIVPVARSQVDFKETVIDDDGNIDVKIVGSIMQFPLKLAWGLTIHKGQGQTLDSVYVNLANCFAPGQAYTAISRVRTLAGLYLLQPFNIGQIICDPSVANWL